MPTPPGAVGAAYPSALAAAATPLPRAADQFGQETFLKLLVAQLRYQDPTKPQDGAEFLSQTAQFTSLEKLSEVAALQTELLAAQRLLGASSLLGQTVTYAGPDGHDVSGVVTATRLSADGPVLRVADTDVPVTSVKEVRPTAG